MSVTGAAHIYQWGIRALVQVSAWGAVAFGLGLIWGGPARFTSPGFATAREVPGSCYTWGALMAVSGVLTLAGAYGGWHRRVVIVGVSCQALWYMFFAIALGFAFSQDPKVATTGWMVYGLMGIVQLILAVVGHTLRGLPR